MTTDGDWLILSLGGGGSTTLYRFNTRKAAEAVLDLFKGVRPGEMHSLIHDPEGPPHGGLGWGGSA